ncbi:hypothetical protein [Halocola ammonii]
MRTITIDILNEKAIKLLKELEQLSLIRVRGSKKGKDESMGIDWKKFKGAMTKQSQVEIDKQMEDLRNEWD